MLSVTVLSTVKADKSCLFLAIIKLICKYVKWLGNLEISLKPRKIVLYEGDIY